MASILFSAMRNEAPFLLDWIAYHRVIGFDKICIVTNDCTDGSYLLLGKLAAAGVIEHFDQSVPGEASPQRMAVQMLDDMGYLKPGDWGLFLDADEYLNIQVGDGRLTDLTDYLSDNDLTGMLINWRVFGDAGQERFAGSYVSDAYTRCEMQPALTQFKTLFRTGDIAAGFSGELHRCRVAPGAGEMTDFITGAGRPLAALGPGKPKRRHVRWLSNGEEPYSHVENAEIGYDIAQINHYMVRDPHSFALKKARGRGHVAASAKKSRHTNAFYAKNNRNEAEDRSILRWQEAVAREKAVLCDHCDLHAVLAQIDQIYCSQPPLIGDRDQVMSDTNPEPQFGLTFPADVSDFVREIYGQSRGIIEYGSGGSTLLAAELGKPCLSVESDRNWSAGLSEKIAAQFGTESPTRVLYVNIGPTKKWGYPSDKRKSENYWRYPMAPWDDVDPAGIDTVLIDGRMRKACFGAALISIQRETRVLFDDYGDRKRYHDVEHFARPTRTVGRMAEFILTPGMVTAADFRRIIPWFSQMG